MKAEVTRPLKLIFILLVAFKLFGCAESTFSLAQDSRLPVWFHLEAGASREDYGITMDYYVGTSGRTATLKLKNSWGFTVKKVEASLDGLEPQKMPGVSEQRPTYEILRANGEIEIVEHREQGPTFRVTSNEVVWSHFVWSQDSQNGT